MTLKLFTTAFAAALVLPLSAVNAAPLANSAADRAVTHADLDLAKARDVARLEARVAAAIRRACPADGTTLADRRLRSACRTAAEAKARSQVQLAVNAAKADKARLAERRIADFPQG